MVGMPSAELPEPDPDAVTRFRPSGGTLSGYVGIGMVLALGLYLLVAEPGATSVRIALGLAILALLFWVSLVRPRVEAHPRTLVIRNMFRDAHIPLAAIDVVGVRQTLDVWVDDRRYTCIGIGHTLRDIRRLDKSGSAAAGTQPKSYPGLVASRVESLAQAARYDERDPGPVRHRWATLEVALLVALVLAFAVALLLG